MYTVYHIKQPNMSTNNGYIGISKNYKSRWRTHKHHLNNGTHSNPHLQNAWNKYNDIIFEVLHTCTTEKEVLEYETSYRPTPNIGWNCKSGGTEYVTPSQDSIEKRRIANTGRKHSEESKQKMSIAAKARLSNRKGSTVSDYTKLLLKNANLGKKASLPTRKKVSEAMAAHKNPKFWIHTSGLTFYGAPWEFSYTYPEQNLDVGALGRVYTEKYKQHKGWYLFE